MLFHVYLFICSTERLIGQLYDVVTGDKFEVAIMTVIMCNMVMMMIQHHGQSSQVTTVLHILLPGQVFSFVSYFHKVRFLIYTIYLICKMIST